MFGSIFMNRQQTVYVNFLRPSVHKGYILGV
jgi:hypothetical protein